MSLSFDVYGRRSLEARFIFYLTALVLMMMVFCGTVVLTEAHRYLLEEAGRTARRTARQTVRLLSDIKVSNPTSYLDPDILCVAQQTRSGWHTIAGHDAREFTIPTNLTVPSSVVEWAGGDGRSCWCFQFEEGEKGTVVVVDVRRPMGSVRRMALTFVWTGGLTLLLHYLLAVFMARSVLRPLRQFIQAIHKVNQGQLTFEMPVKEQDEVGQLKGTFNFMLAQLKEKDLMARRLRNQEHMATVGHLAAGVAHEIRNPLASISSLTQLVNQDPQASGKSREYAEVILREVKRMDESIRQLLEFARPVPTEFRPTRLSETVKHVETLMAPEAERRGVTLEARIEWADESPVLVDSPKLEQVLINLIKNAIEELPQGGNVRLRLDFDGGGDHALLIVEDDGPGLTEDIRTRLFDPFFSTKPRGSGLGLAIVHKIVQVHNGQIRVDSELGRGTRFTVALPRMQPGPRPANEGVD